MKHDIATPYTAVYIIIRKEGKIAFVLRENTSWMNGHYGFPAGRVERGESFLAAAAREAKEEAGITVKPEDLKHILTLHRNDVDSVWVDICFEATKWEGEPYNAEPESHSELAWLDPNNLPQNIIPSIPFILEQIAAGKHFTEYGWQE